MLYDTSLFESRYSMVIITRIAIQRIDADIRLAKGEGWGCTFIIQLLIALFKTTLFYKYLWNLELRKSRII